MEMMDKNQLLGIYSLHFGNRENNLLEYGKRNGIKNIDDIIKEFSNIQGELFDYFWKKAAPDGQLYYDEIKAQAFEYCNEKYKWMNDMGKESLLRWLVWICWHEGLLKRK